MRLLHIPLVRFAALAALLGATLWFAGQRLADGATSIDRDTLASNATPLALAVAIFAVSTLLLGAAWIALIEDASRRGGRRLPLMLAFVYAWLVRYVPGTVPFFAGKVYLGKRAGYDTRQLALVTGIQNMIEVLVSAIVGAICIAVALGITAGGGAYLALAAAPALLLPALHPSVLGRVTGRALRALGRDPLPDGALPSVRAVTVASCCTAANQLLNGAAMLMVMIAVSDASIGDFALVTGALSLAGVAGILVVLAPAGLGVRDGALTGLLAARFSVEAAAVAAVLVRLLMIVADLALVAVALLADIASGSGVISNAFLRKRGAAVEPRMAREAALGQRRSA